MSGERLSVEPRSRFHSVLYVDADDAANVDRHPEPECFADLNLDQVVEWIIKGREGYNLKPFFYAPLRDVRTVKYRQQVMRDLENPDVLAAIESFADGMRLMRKHLTAADKSRYEYQKKRWFLDAVDVYCSTVRTLADRLASVNLQSAALIGFRDYVASYVSSDEFTTTADRTRVLLDDLATVTYCVTIRGNRVRVSMYEEEDNYSRDVEETFAKFKQGAVKDYRVNFPNLLEMDHVEARILGLVARRYPEIFAALDDYYQRQQTYRDEKITAFDREIQFYVAYLAFIAPLRRSGLGFCYPAVSTQSKEVRANSTFDLALASKLNRERAVVVINDFALSGPERILVVTGPNQGGKTTFARMFGQLHYLASLGFAVPGTEAKLFLPDQVFTHFEREEDIATLQGKLENELVRLRHILDAATGDSIVIMNESFGSTTLSDALFLAREIMRRIMELDLLCVCVTFIDELSALSETTVSMVGTVVPENPAERTYKIIRRPADGLAYAAAIARKYGLTYELLTRRLAS